MNKDLELWRKNNTYKLWQAVLLIIGQSPDGWSISKILNGETPNGFLPVFEKMIEDARECKKYRDEVGVNEFQIVTILDEYELMIYNISDRDNRTHEEWLSTVVSKDEIRNWVKLRGYKTNFFDENFEGTSSTDKSELSDSEKTSLLKIVLALASNKYKYPNHGALAAILRGFDENDNGVAENTLTKYLTMAQQYLPKV